MNDAAVYEVTVEGHVRTVRVRPGRAPGRFLLAVENSPEVEIEAMEPEPGVLSLLVAGRSWEADVEPVDDGYVVGVLGIPHDVGVVDPRRKALRTSAASSGAVVRTQMPGRIVRVLVGEGDVVATGDSLVVVEAMKMENELKAPRAGTVKRVCVAVGDLVEGKAALVELVTEA